MAVVTVATTKGGVGKSTTIVNLAAAAWQSGASVVVFDCDPQKHSKMMLSRYLERMSEDYPDRIKARKELRIVDDSTQENLLDRLAEANEKYDLALIDLQGSANQMMLISMTESDLVIIPVQPSSLDIDGAALAWANVRHASRISRRPITGRIFFVRVQAAIRPKVLTETLKHFEEMGIPVMGAQFVERTAFKESTFDGKFPSEYAPDSAAAANVRAIYKEILDVLQAETGEGA